MKRLMLGCAAAGLFAADARATVASIPDSALLGSSTYYTDTIGQGIGDVVVMTDGGNAPGVGDPTGRNDDGFSGPVPLGFNLTLFGQTYSSMYINNNGNVSFGAGIAPYIQPGDTQPTGPQGAPQPIIAPFFNDVDTRTSASGVVHLLQLADEDIVTWDAVGYFNQNIDATDSFQLVLRSANYAVPSGESDIGFWYTTMGWEATDTADVGAIGVGDGNGNGAVLDGSLAAGLDATVNDTHLWLSQDLVGGTITPVPDPTPDPNPTPNPIPTVPEPTTLALLATGLLGLGFVRRRRAG